MLMFIIKESLKSITTAKLSFVLSLIAGIISIFIVSIAVLLLGFSDSIEKRIKEKITFTAFLPDSLNEEQIEEVKSALLDLNFVKSIDYVDKTKAEELFIQQTGENFKGILDYNPLPASIEIKIKPDYLMNEEIVRIENILQHVGNIDEIIIQRSFIINLLTWLETIRFYLAVAGIFLFLVALYLVFSMNKIIIHNKTPQIETMKLVGAKNLAIKLPFILNGLIIGLFSSLLCITFYKILLLLLNFQVQDLFTEMVDSLIFIMIIISTGIILGILGSILALGRIGVKIRKINF